MIVSTLDYVQFFNLSGSAACFQCKQLSSKQSVSDLILTGLQNLSKEKSDYTDSVLGKTKASLPKNSRSVLLWPLRQRNPLASFDVVKELQALMSS